MQIDLVPNFSLLVIAIIFLLNYLVVRNFLFKPINRILNERDDEICSAQQRHEEALTRYNAAVAQIEAKLHHARREGSMAREKRRAEAVQHRAGLIERTRREAERIVTEASQRLSSQVASARDKIVKESETLARLAAERIVGRKIA